MQTTAISATRRAYSTRLAPRSSLVWARIHVASTSHCVLKSIVISAIRSIEVGGWYIVARQRSVTVAAALDEFLLTHLPGSDSPRRTCRGRPPFGVAAPRGRTVVGMGNCLSPDCGGNVLAQSLTDGHCDWCGLHHRRRCAPTGVRKP